MAYTVVFRGADIGCRHPCHTSYQMLLQLQTQRMRTTGLAGRRGHVRHAVAVQAQVNGRANVPALPDVSGLKLAPERPVWHAPKSDDEEMASSSYDVDNSMDEYQRRAMDSVDASTSGRDSPSGGAAYSRVLLRHGLLPAPPEGWQSWHTRLPAHGKAAGSTRKSMPSTRAVAAGQREAHEAYESKQPSEHTDSNRRGHTAFTNGHVNGTAAAELVAQHAQPFIPRLPSHKDPTEEQANTHHVAVSNGKGPDVGNGAQSVEEMSSSSTDSSTQVFEEHPATGTGKRRQRQAKKPPAWLGIFSYLPSAVAASTHNQQHNTTDGSRSSSGGGSSSSSNSSTASSGSAAHNGTALLPSGPSQGVGASGTHRNSTASHQWTQQHVDTDGGAWMHHMRSQAAAAANQPAEPSEQQQQHQHTQAESARTADSGASSSAAGTAASSLNTLRSRRNRFMDEHYELAISAWVKQAPDWFAVQRIVEANLSRLNILHVAVIAHKLAQLTSSTHRSMLNKERSAFVGLMGQLMRHAVLVSPGLDGRTACNLLHSVAKLQCNVQGLQVDSELLQVVLLRLQPFLPSVKAQELSSAVWALGMLRHVPHQSWLDAMYSATQDRLQEYQPGHLAAMMSGLAHLQVMPPAGWTESLLSSSLSQLDTMRSRELSMMLMALGRLRLRPSTEWLEAVLDEVKQRLDSLGCQALANILWALARLGYTPKHSWLAAYYVASSQLLNSFNPQELSITIWALATLHTWPNDQWLDDYFDQTQEAMEYFSPQHLANTSWALAKLGVRPPKSWMKEFVSQVLRSEEERGLTGPIVHQLMYALAWFKVPSLARWRLRLYDAVGFKVRRTRWRRRQQEQGQEGSSVTAARSSVTAAGSSARSVPVIRGPGDVDLRRLTT